MERNNVVLNSSMNAELIVKRMLAKLIERVAGISHAWYVLGRDDFATRDKIFAELVAGIDEEIKGQQVEFAQFCLFWGDKVHRTHKPATNPISFTVCKDKFCESFRETIKGLGHQVVNVANMDAGAPSNMPRRP